MILKQIVKKQIQNQQQPQFKYIQHSAVNDIYNKMQDIQNQDIILAQVEQLQQQIKSQEFDYNFFDALIQNLEKMIQTEGLQCDNYVIQKILKLTTQLVKFDYEQSLQLLHIITTHIDIFSQCYSFFTTLVFEVANQISTQRMQFDQIFYTLITHFICICDHNQCLQLLDILHSLLQKCFLYPVQILLLLQASLLYHHPIRQQILKYFNVNVIKEQLMHENFQNLQIQIE